jgi:hypothetical protein
VLLSERNPEPNRHNRTRALPVSGPIRPVAIPSKARPNLGDGGRAFSLRVEEQRADIPSSPPGEPRIDPLYLFVCGLSWRRRSNTSAGWELVNCLRSSGQTARIAAAMLAQAENIQLPVRALVRAIDGPGKPSLLSEGGLQTSARRWL